MMMRVGQATMIHKPAPLAGRNGAAPAERDDDRWRAVLARDRTADGAFVFAVRSTRVYCRPSCPARRPRRDRVRFFSGPREAADAGYRPCRRCRPEGAAVGDETGALVRRACRYIETHLDDQVSLRTLGASFGYPPDALRRAFAEVLGISPKRYADACRLDLVKARLRAQAAVTNALYDAGYGSSSRLYGRAAHRLGMTPATYRRGGAGAVIRYTTAATHVGRLLVGATDRGVCAVSLGDSDVGQVTALRSEYPAARLSRDDRALAPAAQAILAYLDGTRPRIDLPLDIQATAFQGRVWDALRAIPYGAVRSYGDVARAIGRPAAARAVARACASNPVSLIIPCHRVIRHDGAPGGYRWGAERKRTLLARERAAAVAPAATPQPGPRAAGGR